MPCTIPTRPTGHDLLQVDLLAAGLRMWASRGRPDVLPRAVADLGHFCESTLLPHLERDERWLRDAQDCAEGHLLAQAMRAEIRAMTGVIEELGSVSEACEAMALTRVVHSFLVAHDHHENLLRATVTTA